MKALISLIFAILYLGLFYNYSENQILFGFSGQENESRQAFPALQVAVTGAALIFGILAGRLHQRLEVVTSNGFSFKSELKGLINSPSLIRSLLISPMIFSIVYLATKEQPDHLVSLVFAFQNGFFCDKIFEMKISSPHAESPGDYSP